MMQRGAGDLDSHAIVEELDFLGVERSSSVSTFHTSTSMACMASVLEPTLKIAVSILREPHFPDSEMEEDDGGAYVLHADHLAVAAAKDAEIALQRTHVETLTRSLHTQSADLKRAEQEAAALRADAERYRYLKTLSAIMWSCEYDGNEGSSPWIPVDRLDAAIDAARAGGGE
jgi:hypothetical protein